MTPKQQAFVEHYAACGNATEAARLAGYKHPRQAGAENMSKHVTQDALSELTAKVTNARIATAQERQEFWTAVMRADKGYEAEMKDRLKASELLGKANMDFIERTEIAGVVTHVVRYVKP